MPTPSSRPPRAPQRRSGVGAVFATALAAVACLASPAAAVAPGQPSTDRAAAAQLLLTLRQGESTTGPVLRQVTLECSPDGGSHPTPELACDSMHEAEGSPERLGATGDMCTMIFQPVTGEIRGTWSGRTLNFTETYGNECLAGAATDGVLRF
ncbi:SSI family serine proteinase inhibitor [Allostreptomyces psammosilenae]|uniref:Subtilisin inhibitor domain-containing protein n=1 Tax=Allostreptomyces psammosilenae TaxID=1892865 RepID=A0A853A3L2_9ACTN|nr:SSI family serine proteinase inhibitor [Allostreptomyces psammosilenae]NYI07464.1 hypothetical protein [Allostreptomyces psammosilenae]